MKPELEETQEIEENYLQEDASFVPRFLKRLWTNNFFQRTFSYLLARDPDRKHIFLKATSDGRLRVSTEPAGIVTGFYSQITVGTTPTLLRPTKLGRLDILIVNDSTIKLYIGTDSTVTINNGIPIREGSGWSSDTYKGPVYGIVGNGTAIAAVMEI